MACAAKPVLNTLSMATNCSCVVSLPSLSSTNSSRISLAHPHLSISSKPIKLNLSCYQSYSSSPLVASLFSLKKKKNSNFGTVFSAVAAQQEEDNTLVLEEADGEQQFEFQDGDSEFEVENSLEETSEEESEEESEGGFEGFAGDEAGDADEGEFQEPSEDAKLFVGNLPYDVDSETLAHLFEQAGAVEIAEVIYNRETDQSRGFGFVTMSTVEEAEKAVELFNRYDLGGRFLTVNKAAPRGTRPERAPRVFEPASRIYVGNLPWDVDDGRLEQVFSEHGKVISARVVTDRDSGRSRGFGFVTMSSESEMNDAIANLDGQSLDGRAIKVNVAEQRPRRNF